MRDATVNPVVEEAIAEVSRVLGMAMRLGRFRQWPPEDESDGLRIEARLLLQLHDDWDMPAHMRKFLLELLSKKKLRPRGRGRYAEGAYRRRDADIVAAIDLIQRRGFPVLSRNPATRHRESACSIVSKVLKRIGVKLDESRVAEIWDHRVVPNESAVAEIRRHLGYA